jgi:M6 family metalloprotease-like protein
MHPTTTQGQERRESGPCRPRRGAVLIYAAFVLAAMLALAAGASPVSYAQPRALDGASALPPPRLALPHGQGRWAHRRVAGVIGNGMLVAQKQTKRPSPCSPSLYSAPLTEMNEGTTNSALPLKPQGREVPAVMLFVDFPDLHATESTSTLYEHLVPRSRAWFDEVSYGHVRLDVSPVKRWFRLPRSLRSYGLADGISWPEHHDYIAAAVAAADGAVDFSRYRVVYVVAAKGTRVERSPAFEAYPGSGIEADGTELRYGATFFEDTKLDARYAANVLIHETGHILGLPDLYDVRDSGLWSLFRFAGGWDTMSWNDPGFHFLAWEKWKLGWLEPSQLTCLDSPGELTATLSPLERAGGLKAVVLPTSASSALVVEARRRIGQDAGLCDEGVLVYAVDASVRGGYGPVRVRPAQSDRNSELRGECGPLYNAPFDHANGAVARFDDLFAGLTVRVLSSGPRGYRVRVTRVTSHLREGLRRP